MNKVVHEEIDVYDTVFKSQEKYNFSCHSNIIEFATKQLLSKRKDNFTRTTDMTVRIKFSVQNYFQPTSR